MQPYRYGHVSVLLNEFCIFDLVAYETEQTVSYGRLKLRGRVEDMVPTRGHTTQHIHTVSIQNEKKRPVSETRARVSFRQINRYGNE